MAVLQHLPWLGTAEDEVTFVEWLAAEGETVKAGQPLAAIETLKAAFEIECEHDGVLLRRLCGPGDRMAASAAIAVVGAAGERCDDASVEALRARDSRRETPPVPQPASAGGPTFTATPPSAPVAPAARRRAAELGINPARVTGSGPEGLVR